MQEKTWQDAAAQWLREKGHKRSLDKDRDIFAWLAPHLGAYNLSQIDREKLLQVAALKASTSSPITANRYMALVRAVLRRACEVWEWIERVPKAPMYTVNNIRVRWLTRREATALLALLPRHQEAMARFALATGLRQRNVCLLKWADVDEIGCCVRIAAAHSKNKKPLTVPLNSAARAVLDGRRGIHPEYVFTFQGRAVRHVNTGAWRNAVKAAGLIDFRWHDLRHTWASWHAQAGTPINVLQELGGWSSYEMVRRYAHLSTAHLAPYAERVAGL